LTGNGELSYLFLLVLGNSVTYFGPAKEEVRDGWKKSPHKEFCPIETVIERIKIFEL
jgi:hypothetical protein